MKSIHIQEQIEKLEHEISLLKADLYEHLEAIKHLVAVKSAMEDEETNDKTN